MSVISWVKSRLSMPETAGPEILLRRFSPDLDVPIASDGVSRIDDGWRIETRGKRSFRLFEVSDPEIEQCLVSYKAGQRPDMIKLNFTFEGPGAVDLRDVHLTCTPLA